MTITMDTEPAAGHWLIQAAAFLRRLTTAETRFAASMRMSRVTMLAAADELETATKEATGWMVGHPCPDAELGGCVALMLSTCTAIAVTSQRALIHPSGNIEAALGRPGGHRLPLADPWRLVAVGVP